MTTKTKRTLELLDALAPPKRAPKLVIPTQAWAFYVVRNPPNDREWWQVGCMKYEGGLVIQTKD